MATTSEPMQSEMSAAAARTSVGMAARSGHRADIAEDGRPLRTLSRAVLSADTQTDRP